MEQEDNFAVVRSLVQIVDPQSAAVAVIDLDVARFERKTGQIDEAIIRCTQGNHRLTLSRFGMLSISIGFGGGLSFARLRHDNAGDPLVIWKMAVKISQWKRFETSHDARFRLDLPRSRFLGPPFGELHELCFR